MKVNFKYLKSLIGIFIFHLILYGPRFIFLDIFFFTAILLSFVYVGLLLFGLTTIPRPMLLFLGLFSISFAYTTIIGLIYNFKDTSLLFDFPKIIIFSFSSLLTVKFVRHYSKDFILTINKCIYYSTVLNGLIVIITQFSSSVRTSLLPKFSFKLATSWDVLSGVRSTDWSMGGGTALSLIFVAIYVLGKNYRNSLRFYLECNIILILACFLSGRTGLYLLIVIECLTILRRLLFKNLKLSNFAITKATIFRFCLYPLLGVIMIWKFSKIIDFDIINNKVLPWAFESFYKYSESGKIESGTTNILFNDFYFLPKSDIEALFGKLDFVTNTDVGYIKIIHYIGFIGLILTIIPFLYMFYYTFINYRRFYCAKFLFFYICLIFLINFKELFLMNSRTGFLLLMIWFSVLIITSSSKHLSYNKFNE